MVNSSACLIPCDTPFFRLAPFQKVEEMWWRTEELRL